jgi:hypothetical protein
VPFVVFLPSCLFKIHEKWNEIEFLSQRQDESESERKRRRESERAKNCLNDKFISKQRSESKMGARPSLIHLADMFRRHSPSPPSASRRRSPYRSLSHSLARVLAMIILQLSRPRWKSLPPSPKMNGRVNKFPQPSASALSLTHNISTFGAITLGNGFIKYLFSASRLPFRRVGEEIYVCSSQY